jgi:hypothetical protein
MQKNWDIVTINWQELSDCPRKLAIYAQIAVWLDGYVAALHGENDVKKRSEPVRARSL